MWTWSVVPSLRFAVGSEAQFRPPLANQLFDERREFVNAMNQYPQMSALVPRLRRASQLSGNTIEASLRHIQEETDVFPRRKSHLMALEFYLSDILRSTRIRMASIRRPRNQLCRTD